MDKIPHDFRWTAMRNMVRAGILEREAMSLVGYKTHAAFDRYYIIVSDNDLREAVQKLDRAVSTPNGHSLRHTAQVVHAENSLSA